MTAAPTISVAMATYNGARFIGKQLQSLADQTVLPAELIVSDDGSTDGMLDIVAGFAAKAPFPVRIVKNPAQLGYRANFMKTAGLCQSDFIAFCDQDDMWLPHKLETCLAAASHDDILLVYHNATVVTEDLKPVDTIASRGAPQEINPPLSLGPWRFGLGFTLMFRRALLAFIGEWQNSVDYWHPDTVEGHDQWFFFLASSLGSIGYVKEPLVLYRQHEANIFGWAMDTRSAVSRLWSDIKVTGAATFHAREAAAGKRAAILERIQGSLSGDQAQHAIRAAAGYRKLETIYRLRREMYLAGNIFSRSRKLMNLAQMGGYRRQENWDVGLKALARDFTRGLLFPARRIHHAGKKVRK